MWTPVRWMVPVFLVVAGGEAAPGFRRLVQRTTVLRCVRVSGSKAGGPPLRPLPGVPVCDEFREGRAGGLQQKDAVGDPWVLHASGGLRRGRGGARTGRIRAPVRSLDGVLEGEALGLAPGLELRLGVLHGPRGESVSDEAAPPKRACSSCTSAGPAWPCPSLPGAGGATVSPGGGCGPSSAFPAVPWGAWPAIVWTRSAPTTCCACAAATAARQRSGRAFAEYGRIARTEHLLRMVDPVDDTCRRQMTRQLTVQESRHTPARDMCHGKRRRCGPRGQVVQDPDGCADYDGRERREARSRGSAAAAARAASAMAMRCPAMAERSRS